MTAVPLTRLAPLALLVLLAASCGDDEKSSNPSPQPPPSATTPSDTTPATKATGSGPLTGRNRLVMGNKRNLYPLLGGSLQRFAPTQVNGYSTRVIALAGPESFWAGRSRRQRILVKLRLKGAKTPAIRVGQKATFVGLLTVTSSKEAEGLGVKDSAGQNLLETEGVYVDVSAFDLKLR